MRILVVEDDTLVAQALMAILSNQNYAVEVATDGQMALELVQAFDYDLVLSDVMLPKIDGIRLCQQMRSQGYQMPILLLTGRNSNHDKAVGLDAGADDYVVKPFDEEELVARIRALLRRGSAIAQPTLQWGNLKLDPSSCQVSYGSKLLPLTPKEYALLELFLRNNHRVFSCNAILEHLWVYEDTPGEEAVRTHIKGLRHKLKAAGAAPDLIETVYGIGYRLKPIETIKALTSEQLDSLADKPDDTRQQTLRLLADVWKRLQKRAKQQIEVLERFAASLTENCYSQDLQLQANQSAHSLAGSLGTFGFSEGSRVARQIEGFLKLGPALNASEIDQMQGLIAFLKQAIEQSSRPDLPMSDHRPLLLVVDRDRAIAEELVREAEQLGLRSTIASDLNTARDLLYHQAPSVVVFDPDCSDNLADGLSLLNEFHCRKPPVPVVVFTAHSSLSDRIEIVRQGGRAFLTKTTPVSQVLESVQQVLQQTTRAEAKVMVVDDDPNTLTMLQSLLTPWGLRLTALEDPKKFWEMLEASTPDLLILDVEMPELTGIELCQVVRNDPRWNGLPILFLTAHNEPSTVNQVFAVGADDFVSKPLIGPELVTRIINRIERIKLLRRMAETDPLDFAKRYTQPLCLAILDIDHFKQVNHRYGHATGDAVLRQIGHLLHHSLRSEDVVARWGGGEFVIGLYGMTKADGVQRLTQLLKTLREQTFTAPNHPPFQVTYSAGVAQYSEDGFDLQSLYQSADAALAAAKQAGRDRILAAQPVTALLL
jgi:diguanylate cyclase (GGDEF)-like protein